MPTIVSVDTIEAILAHRRRRGRIYRWWSTIGWYTADDNLRKKHQRRVASLEDERLQLVLEHRRAVDERCQRY